MPDFSLEIQKGKGLEAKPGNSAWYQFKPGPFAIWVVNGRHLRGQELKDYLYSRKHPEKTVLQGPKPRSRMSELLAKVKEQAAEIERLMRLIDSHAMAS